MTFPTCYLPIEAKKDIRKTYPFDSEQQNAQNNLLLTKAYSFTI